MPKGGPPARFTYHVSFRLDDEQAFIADSLRGTMEYQTWAEVGRWLFSEPEVLEVIKKRVRGEVSATAKP